MRVSRRDSLMASSYRMRAPRCPLARAWRRRADECQSLEPVARDQETLGELRFAAARLRMPVVAPPHQRRKRQQDGFGAAARLQSEQRAAIPDQVELHVAAAPIRLEVALAIPVRRVLASREDRRVHRQESVADRAREGEAPVEAFGVEVVEEDAADAPRLLAMTQIEVIVAGALHLRIERGAVRRER